MSGFRSTKIKDREDLKWKKYLAWPTAMEVAASLFSHTLVVMDSTRNVVSSVTDTDCKKLFHNNTI